jgi:hypothetical protein
MTPDRAHRLRSVAYCLGGPAVTIGLVLALLCLTTPAPVRGGILPPGVIVVSILSVAVAYLCSKLRSWPMGLCAAVFAPVFVCYVIAWGLMTPLLHPGAEPAGGWDLVATIFWTIWAVPVCLANYVFFRWRKSRKHTAL